jgi:hypothetical protein
MCSGSSVARARINLFVAIDRRVGGLAITSAAYNHGMVADSELRFYTTSEIQKEPPLIGGSPLTGGDDY